MLLPYLYDAGGKFRCRHDTCSESTHSYEHKASLSRHERKTPHGCKESCLVCQRTRKSIQLRNSSSNLISSTNFDNNYNSTIEEDLYNLSSSPSKSPPKQPFSSSYLNKATKHYQPYQPPIILPKDNRNPNHSNYNYHNNHNNNNHSTNRNSNSNINSHNNNNNNFIYKIKQNNYIYNLSNKDRGFESIELNNNINSSSSDIEDDVEDLIQLSKIKEPRETSSSKGKVDLNFILNDNGNNARGTPFDFNFDNNNSNNNTVKEQQSPSFNSTSNHISFHSKMPNLLINPHNLLNPKGFNSFPPMKESLDYPSLSKLQPFHNPKLNIGVPFTNLNIPSIANQNNNNYNNNNNINNIPKNNIDNNIIKPFNVNRNHVIRAKRDINEWVTLGGQIKSQNDFRKKIIDSDVEEKDYENGSDQSGEDTSHETPRELNIKTENN